MEPRNSILHHLKRKERPGDLPKKKKPKRPKANMHLSVLDQIERLEHQENDDVSPQRKTQNSFNFKRSMDSKVGLSGLLLSDQKKFVEKKDSSKELFFNQKEGSAEDNTLRSYEIRDYDDAIN
jgi:hypothetical protein